MKRVIQLALLSVIVISIFVFNKIYFSEEKKIVVDTDIPISETINQDENNIIKNLKYEVKLEDDNWYIISSEFSEITYINNFELIKMREVFAQFRNKKNITITVVSDEALYDNSNYNTKFRKNVQIEFMNNKIFSDKVDINFQDNTIKIFENVKYVGIDGTVTSDNIMINMITKKVNIFMNEENNKVEITKN
tara:strand:+ start:1048 stop:1623 length:576 start_codon:yes stop_codon:yes gene_type:complete